MFGSVWGVFGCFRGTLRSNGVGLLKDSGREGGGEAVVVRRGAGALRAEQLGAKTCEERRFERSEKKEETSKKKKLCNILVTEGLYG